WARRPPPPEPAPPRPLVPSAPEAEEGEPPVLAPVGPGSMRRFRRGRLIHRLLQVLPELPPERRAMAAERMLARAGDLDAAARAAIAREALAVLETPGLGQLFGPDSRAEAAVIGRLPVAGAAERVIAGQIDRLVVGDHEVLIVDYKTNRPPPRAVADTPALYLRQMAAYRAVIARVYPGRRVRCALLWTDGPFAMLLPDEALDRFDPTRAKPAPLA
ncbi:MAG: PD-(D/E)XK nuclease family protein, partial [Alphaproteobacteria bacterium]|nr:PD-(D/E)XK nuclease family protein [Alphaproteobacteria bacterium]